MAHLVQCVNGLSFFFSFFFFLCTDNPEGLQRWIAGLKGGSSGNAGWLVVPWEERNQYWMLGHGRFPYIREPLWYRFGKWAEWVWRDRSYTERQRLANEEENKDRKEEEPAGGLADVLAGSGKVHGVLGVIVDLNRLGQCLGVPAITLTWHMAALGAARQGQEGVISHHRKATNRSTFTVLFLPYLCTSSVVRWHSGVTRPRVIISLLCLLCIYYAHIFFFIHCKKGTRWSLQQIHPKQKT